jgi:hemerythrin-like domain-containing protein
MNTYLDSPIREVMDRFPEVGRILDDYGVGCVTCGVGTCPVKDIISIHHLDPEDERAVMNRIATVVGSADGPASPADGRSVAPPVVLASGATAAGSATGSRAGAAIRYSPPLKQLVDEHGLIKKWLAIIPEVVETLDLESPEDRQLVLDGVDFIRSYADRLHHAKEEDVLFKRFDESKPILQVMLADHEQARAHARAVEEGVRNRDKAKVADHLLAYRDLLSEHIRKEDNILYPWMDRELTTTQVGELFASFAEADERIGPQVPARNNEFISRAKRFVATKKERAR